MRILLMLAALAAVLQGCASTEEEAVSLFDRLEFQEGQQGCLRVSGQVSVGGNPFASSDVNVNLVKQQGDDAPDC